MKKIIFVFIGLCVFGLFYFIVTTPETAINSFISIDKNGFKKNKQAFYPLVLNYIASIQTDRKQFWPCPTKAYNSDSKFNKTSKEACLLQLKADMELIKEMGFNTVRIVGIGEEYIADDVNGELAFGAAIGNEKDTTITLSKKENYDHYLNPIKELLQIVNEAGLKSILLLRMSADVEKTTVHLGKVAAQFKNDTSILAFDVFNEPLYFDKPERTKQEVYKKLTEWRTTVKQNAPNHLITIGLTGVREVMEWDPNILAVDFISFHPYEYETEQVRNELFWYGKYVKKPWIIGETAVPADNDSVSYDIQKTFATNTINQAYNCGAVGYSWWQYKDVNWNNFHADYMGMLNLKGETKTKNNLSVNGTVKPVAKAIQEFNPNQQKEKCMCLDNYYNYSMKKDFRLTGKLIDSLGNPIEGGIILAWNQNCTSSFHTISKEDGTFELLGAFPFYHWMLSATEYSMIRGELLPDTAKQIDGIPTIRLDNLKLNKLEFPEN